MIRKVIIGDYKLNYNEFKALATLAGLEGFKTLEEFNKFLKSYFSK